MGLTECQAVAVPVKEENNVKEEKAYAKKEYIPISKATYAEKYYLLKWIKPLIDSGSTCRYRDCFKLLCDTDKLFNLNMPLEKYSNKTKSDFFNYNDYEEEKDYNRLLFSWSNFEQDWSDKLSKVVLEKEEDLFLNKVNWLKELFTLEEIQLDYIVYLFYKRTPLFSHLSGATGNKESDWPFWNYFNDVDNFVKSDVFTKLYEKGLVLCNDPKMDFNILSNVLFDTLKNTEINTKQKFFNSLLGEPEKVNLKLKDFEYIQSDKVINILKNSKDVTGINILLYGAVGTGKTEFSKILAKEAGLKLYSVKTELPGYKEAKREDRLTDLYSKQILLSKTNNKAILFDEAEDVLNRGFCENGTSSKGYMNRLLENTKVPVIWTTNNVYDVDPAFLRRMTYCIKFEKLNEEQRLHIWNNILKQNKLKIGKETLNKLNEEYDVYPSIISNAVKTVKMIDGGDEDFSDIIESVASVVSKKNEVKNKKDNKLEDYDLSLINTNTNIPNLTDKIKECGKLNFSLCLYGEPGTGKSLYARYLANQLGLEVIQKRASDLISSWVGETEQNIAAAFSEAKSKKAMLIFDEADSFLQNRNNAIRSWEVTQVNEMLTQMESYEYPFVCTTNLMDSLDEASLRRFTFKVAFNFMTKEQVKKGLKHFFDIDTDVFIKGLTPGDFATVKKRVEFLNIKDEKEIYKMLQEEVKVKKSKTLQNTIGF